MRDIVGCYHVDCNLPDRLAVNAACQSAVDNDSVGCTLPCEPTANAAFAWNEAVTRMERRRDSEGGCFAAGPRPARSLCNSSKGWPDPYSSEESHPASMYGTRVAEL